MTASGKAEETAKNRKRKSVGSGVIDWRLSYTYHVPVPDPFAECPARFPCTPGIDPRFAPSSAKVIRQDSNSGHKPVLHARKPSSARKRYCRWPDSRWKSECPAIASSARSAWQSDYQWCECTRCPHWLSVRRKTSHITTLFIYISAFPYVLSLI